MLLERTQHVTSTLRWLLNHVAQARRTFGGSTTSFHSRRSSSGSMKRRTSASVPSRSICSYTRARSARSERSYRIVGPLHRTCIGRTTVPCSMRSSTSPTDSGTDTGRDAGPRWALRVVAMIRILRRGCVTSGSDSGVAARTQHSYLSDSKTT